MAAGGNRRRDSWASRQVTSSYRRRASGADRLEPAVDEMRREFERFQKTVEKLGEMANDASVP